MFDGTRYDAVGQSSNNTRYNELGSSQICTTGAAYPFQKILFGIKSLHIFDSAELDRNAHSYPQEWRERTLQRHISSTATLINVSYLVKRQRPFIFKNAACTMYHSIIGAFGRRLHALREPLHISHFIPLSPDITAIMTYDFHDVKWLSH